MFYKIIGLIREYVEMIWEEFRVFWEVIDMRQEMFEMFWEIYGKF